MDGSRRPNGVRPSGCAFWVHFLGLIAMTFGSQKLLQNGIRPSGCAFWVHFLGIIAMTFGSQKVLQKGLLETPRDLILAHLLDDKYCRRVPKKVLQKGHQKVLQKGRLEPPSRPRFGSFFGRQTRSRRPSKDVPKGSFESTFWMLKTML